MTPFRRRLRKLRFLLQALMITLIISVAVLVGFAQLALPWLADNPKRIETWLSERLGRTVSIGHVQGLWTRAGPRLVLDEVRIAAGAKGEAALNVQRAELALNLYAAFQQNRAWNEFRLVGLDLALIRESSGELRLLGFDLGIRSSDEPRSMGALGAIVLVDLKLAVVDATRDLKLDLFVPELRVVNLGRITRVLGRVGSRESGALPFSLVADIDVDNKSGRLYVGGHTLDLAEISAGHAIGGIGIVSGSGDLEIWANWKNGQPDDIRLKLDIGQTVLEAKTTVDAGASVSVLPRSLFDRLALTARWLRSEGGWKFDIAEASATRQGLASAPARIVVERMSGEPARYHLSANAVDLGALGSAAMLADVIPDGLRRWIYLGNPHGSVRAIDLLWNSAEDYAIDMQVEAFGSRSAGAIPGIESLDARLRGDAQSVLFEVPAQATRVEYPKVFRKPFELSAFGGDLLIWPEGDAWKVQTSDFGIEGAGFSVDLRGGIELQADGSRPLLELSALVNHADVQAAKLFWTVNTMAPNVVDWLDRALVSGTLQARAVIRGDLDSWPFDDNTGRFEGRADLRGLELAYLPEWPHGENLDVTARFINNGMFATATGGNSMAVAIDLADATIASFRDPQLTLSVDSHADGKSMLSFLRATPVGAEHAQYLGGLGIGGTGVSHIQLDIPLKDKTRMTLDGSVVLSDADLDESNWGLGFKKANGSVRFSRTGVLADKLAVDYEGRPVTLGIAIGSSTRDPLNSFEATLDGMLPTSTVFARAADLAPALPSFPGEAQWNIDLAIGADGGAANDRKELRIESDLSGIAIQLPAPLNKQAETIVPFSLVLQMPLIGQPFTARLGEILNLSGTLPGPGKPLSARLDFGPLVSSEPAPASGVFIGGHTTSLDVGGWIKLFSAGDTGSDLLKGMAFDVDDLQLADRNFPDLHIELAPDTETTTISVSGEMLDGELSLPMNDVNRRGITAQMNRVHWPEPPEGTQDGPATLAGVAPASLPPLHLWIGELQLGNSNLGELRLESYPTADGMRIDLLETKSAHVDMHASGDWIGSAAENRSHLVIDMTAKSLGSMLDSFGYAGIIDGGQTLAHIDASWPGAPTAFALANTTGTLEVNVEKGRILDVDPGAGGRLFGLLSLGEIPRRLSLDFSDLFKEGMSFNSIKGTFALRDGNAYTDDLLINSPAANITITGRTGLRIKDYDQQMSVTPRAGVTLPLVGALAGGPVGAAAGLVVQGLFGKQIGRAAGSNYEVTGSWAKPVIKEIRGENKQSSHEDKSKAPLPDSIIPESVDEPNQALNASGAESAVTPEAPVPATLEPEPEGESETPPEDGNKSEPEPSGKSL